MVDTHGTTQRISLRIVHAGEEKRETPVVARVTSDPLYMGGGETDLLCGNCQWLLANGVEPERIPSVLIKCPRCDAYNHTKEAEVA